MPVSSEILFVAAVAAVAFLGGLLYLRSRSRRTRTRRMGHQPSVNRPENLRFTCAGCSRQFTHSRRTLTAWEGGARRFLCKACHTKRHGVLPSPGTGSVQRMAEKARRRPKA